MEKNFPIQMRLKSVNEISFSMSSGKLGEVDRGNELMIGFQNNVNPNIDDDIFTTDFGVQYSIGGEIILQSVYRFVFDVKNLSEFVSKDQHGKVNVKGILPHVISVAVGTMRGILVVKTAGTDLGRYPIPMMDPVQLCENLAK